LAQRDVHTQLVDHGQSWKSYQESLPRNGADRVNFSDGFFTDASDMGAVLPSEKQSLIFLYAAKHDPFVYFRSVQDGHSPSNSLKNIVGFEGSRGLYDDLATGHVPAFSFIVPNQCNDQHGRGHAGPACDFDPSKHGVHSTRRYTHFSLLRTLEAAFGLPCLNHACDAGAGVMDDLFKDDR